jgi:hypothetical protein
MRVVEPTLESCRAFSKRGMPQIRAENYGRSAASRSHAPRRRAAAIAQPLGELADAASRRTADDAEVDSRRRIVQ